MNLVARPLAFGQTIDHYDESQQSYIVQHALSGNNQRNDPDGEHFVVGFSQESDGSTVRNAKNLARPITGRHGDPGVVAIQHSIIGHKLEAGAQGKGWRDDGATWTLDSRAEADTIAGSFGVRRLTPLECERLQGFPDTWTAVNGMSDSARYRMLGNAVAVPVAEWIGRRIADQARGAG